MGMSDDFIIEYELPIPELPKTGWQSKDFDCAHNLFTLTKKGRLTELFPVIEIVNEEVHLTGQKETRDCNYEGVFTVYNVVNETWYQFEIAMIGGEVKLVKIEKTEKIIRCENSQ